MLLGEIQSGITHLCAIQLILSWQEATLNFAYKQNARWFLLSLKLLLQEFKGFFEKILEKLFLDFFLIPLSIKFWCE